MILFLGELQERGHSKIDSDLPRGLAQSLEVHLDGRFHPQSWFQDRLLAGQSLFVSSPFSCFGRSMSLMCPEQECEVRALRQSANCAIWRLMSWNRQALTLCSIASGGR